MKILLLLIALAPSTLFAQNLVLNPSFEDTVFCTYTTNYFICKDWVNPNGLTTDHFSPDVSMECWGAGYTVPQTWLGYQQAQNGESYIGMVLYQPNGGNIKEYAQGFLSEPLVAGQTYYIALYINMADSCNYRTCEIEMHFDDELIYNSSQSLNFTSNLVHFDISDVDSINWQLLTATYVANGGEQYVYIGSNTPNNQINCIEEFNDRFPNAAYYYIDNVYISLTPFLNIEEKNIFLKIFPNPAKTQINIENSTIIRKIELLDLMGNKIFESKNSQSNKAIIDVSSFQKGIYILKLDSKICEKIIIN